MHSSGYHLNSSVVTHALLVHEVYLDIAVPINQRK